MGAGLGLVPGKIETVSEDAVGGSSSGGAASTSPSPPAGEGWGEGSRNTASGALYYTARVTLDRTVMDVDGKDVQLAPGMAATVEIKTGKRKLIEYLLSPLMRMTDEAGRER